MKVLADYQARLDQLLKEQAVDLAPEDKDAAIQNAASAHSKYRPRRVVADIAGSGVFDLALPAGWEKGFSAIESVEFPADERQPEYLEDEDWTLYEKPAGQVLRLFNDIPTASQKVRVVFSARHSVDAAAGTIADADFEAVCHLAGSFALGALANRYVQSQDSTISADVVDHKSKSQDAQGRANAEKKIYFSHIGVKEDEIPAGLAFKDYDVNFPWGEDRLTHPRRWR